MRVLPILGLTNSLKVIYVRKDVSLTYALTYAGSKFYFLNELVCAHICSKYNSLIFFEKCSDDT